MTRLTRRLALCCVLLAAGCGQTTTPVTPAQVITDLRAIVGSAPDASGIGGTGLLAALTIIETADPAAIPKATADKITGDLLAARAALTVLAQNPPPVTTGQPQIAQIYAVINSVLPALSVATSAAAVVNPKLAPAVPIMQAVAVLLPMVEAFVQPASAGTAALRASVLGGGMSLMSARAVLGAR